MAKSEVYICDGCGKQKGEVNHWWMINAGSLRFGLSLLQFEEEMAKLPNYKHYCGRECALKAVSAWMNEQAGRR